MKRFIRSALGALALVALVTWLAELTVLNVAAQVAEPVPQHSHAALSHDSSIELGTALAILGTAFGAWAVVLGYVLFVLRHEFAELRSTVNQESERRRKADERAHEDRIHIERRLAELEGLWRIEGRYTSDENQR